MSAYRILFDSSLSHADAPSLSTVAAQQGVTSRPDSDPDVGADRLSHIPLTAESREAAIEQASRIQAKYEAKWEQTGDFGCKGLADWARAMRDQLIAGRKQA